MLAAPAGLRSNLAPAFAVAAAFAFRHSFAAALGITCRGSNRTVVAEFDLACRQCFHLDRQSSRITINEANRCVVQFSRVTAESVSCRPPRRLRLRLLRSGTDSTSLPSLLFLFLFLMGRRCLKSLRLRRIISDPDQIWHDYC